VDLACRNEFPEWDPTDLPQGDGESEESPFDDESRSSGFVEAELKSPRSKGVVSKGKNYSKLKEKLPEVGIDDDNFLNDDFVDDGGQQGASLSTYRRVCVPASSPRTSARHSRLAL
jgi:hypothetical protein